MEETFSLGAAWQDSPDLGIHPTDSYNLVTSCLAAAMYIDFHFCTIDFCFCSHLCLCFGQILYDECLRIVSERSGNLMKEDLICQYTHPRANT